MHDRMSAEVAQFLERSILSGVSAVWDSIYQELCYERRGLVEGLRKPGFMLQDMHPLGKWDPQGKLIILQRDFVFTHPWDAVADLFKHEVAHQIAQELFGATEETSHGPAFQQACRMIRADPRASSEYQSLHDYIRDGKASEADRILDKVNKLLALAQSSSEHEAREAMRKAHELMRIYNVDSIEKRTPRNHFSMFLGRPALRHPPEMAMMGCLLRDFYFVETIWIHAWIIERNRMGRVLEISGTAENLAMAEYVFSFVNHYIERTWEEFRRRCRISGRRRQTDFAAGVIKGFRETLARDEASKGPGNQTSALILARDRELHSYFRFRYPRIKMGSGSSRTIDPEVIAAGTEAGRKLRIHRGVHDTSSGPVKLLTSGT